MAIPIIDKRIKHVGPATLRKMDALKLRGLRELMVIQDGDEPLAVLIPYDMYLEMQKEAAEGQAAIASAAPTVIPGLDKLFMREGPADIADDMVAPSPGPHPPVRGIPYVIENEPEPFQGRSRTASPIDQIHEKDSGWATPKCDHCGKPGVALCQECFTAGHRAVANCQQCAER